jgi:hypothetical protein
MNDAQLIIGVPRNVKPHLLFLTFSCGHQYYLPRVSGGVSDWSNCLCDSCQPYDAVLTINYLCRGCGGSMNYAKDAPQTRLTEQAAEELRAACRALYASTVSISR